MSELKMKTMRDPVLEKARQTYGNKNQILVCIEELNELACVLAKYPRYDSEETATLELRDAVLDEVADVNIILNHVEAIFDFSEEEIEYRIQQKRERLKRWLDASDSMQRTIDDREIACYKERNIENEINCSNCKQTDYSLCKTCFSSEAGEGIRPFFK